MVIVCRQTRYVLAIHRQEKRWDSKNAASFFLDECVDMLWLRKEFICDNASIINSEILKDLFAISGVEQHSSVAYRPQSNKRSERAVQCIVNSRRQYLEQRGVSSKHCCVESLPLALWALSDSPGAVSGYSTHRPLFGSDPVGWWDCLPVSLQDGAGQLQLHPYRMQDNFLVACWTNVLKSESALKTSMQRSLPNFWRNPEQSFKPADRSWVRNRIVEPPVLRKLKGVWQGT